MQSDTVQLINSWEQLKTNLWSSFEGMQKLALEIDEKIKILHEQEEKMSREKQRIAEQISKADEKIKLCVGGTIFMTSKSNLLRFEGSYFHSMLGSGLWQAEQDGSYVRIRPGYYY